MTTLTPEQQRALDAATGAPPVVIDPRTHQAYVLVRAEEYDRLAVKPPAVAPPDAPGASDIPEGVRRSRAALRRDLPELLAGWRTRGKYVLYTPAGRVATGRSYAAMIAECNRRNLPDGGFWIDRVGPGAGSEEEAEIDSSDV